MKIPSFSQFKVASNTMDGKKVEINDVLNKEIVVTNFKVSPSKHYKNKGDGTYTRIQFYYLDDETEEKMVLFTGSSVLKEQLEGIMEETGDTPKFRATITKIADYYTFS